MEVEGTVIREVDVSNREVVNIKSRDTDRKAVIQSREHLFKVVTVERWNMSFTGREGYIGFYVKS